MLYFILSDIHGNLEALVSVLKDIMTSPQINQETRDKVLVGLEYAHREETSNIFPKPTNNPCKIVSLGDIIGYGAKPNECIEIVRNIADISVLGNHEDILFDLEERNLSNEEIKSQFEWTEKNLSPENKKYLEELYQKEKFIHSVENLTFSHGVPTSPRQFHYNKGLEVAQWFKARSFKGKISFMGHCHAVYFFGNLKGELVKHQLKSLAIPFSLKGYHRILLSVPGVGQPRDGNYQTGYLIYDSESRRVLIRRLDYNFNVTQRDILVAGFPEKYIYRLEKGI